MRLSAAREALQFETKCFKSELPFILPSKSRPKQGCRIRIQSHFNYTTGIYTFEDGQLIRDSRQHSKQIQDCLGAPALAQIADKPAVHSAVCLATSSLAVDYARQMSQTLISPPFQACETAGVDTGLHEYLVYSGGVKGALRFDQASGLVMDIQVGLGPRRNALAGEAAGSTLTDFGGMGL